MQVGSWWMLGVRLVCAALAPALQARAAAADARLAGDLPAAIGLLACFALAWRATGTGR